MFNKRIAVTVFFILISFLLMIMPLYAADATVMTTNDTQKAARNFLSECRNSQNIEKAFGISNEKLSAISMSEGKIIKNSKGKSIACVYPLKPKGYIVTSLRKDLPPIFAYSFTSDFSDEEIPENILLIFLRTDLTNRMEAFDRGLLDQELIEKNNLLWDGYVSGKFEKTKSRDTYGPLFDFKSWSQREPYYNKCPIDPQTGERSVVGCGPTAMASILNYWQYPTSHTFTEEDSYTTDTRHIEVDATTASFSNIDYNNSHPDADVIATICFACGVWAQADYSSEETPAYEYPIYESLCKIGFKKARYSKEFSKSEIIQNVIDGRPSIITIREANNEGHVIMIDGYDNNRAEMFHISFGWGGLNDGWCVIPDGLPEPYESVSYSIYDIIPYTEIPKPTPSPTNTVTVASGGSSGGGGCFIATASYGTPMAKEVKTLCKFRDDYLLPNPVGRAITHTYYRLSPPIADRIRQNEKAKSAVRFALTPVVKLVAFTNARSIDPFILVVLMLLALLVVIRKYRKAKVRK